MKILEVWLKGCKSSLKFDIWFDPLGIEDTVELVKYLIIGGRVSNIALDTEK